MCASPNVRQPGTLDHHGVPPLEKRWRRGAGRGAAQDCWPPKPDLAINSTRGERYTEQQVETFLFLFFCAAMISSGTKDVGAESFTRRAGAQQVVSASILCH